MEKTANKGSIIVVDDDRTVRNVISRALRAEGYDVTTAGDGREALEITARKSFDVMFLDIMMPGMSGQDVLTMMALGNPTTPVIMLTAVPDAEGEAINREAFAYLRKPASLKEITAIARQAVLTKYEDPEALPGESADDHREGDSLSVPTPREPSSVSSHEEPIEIFRSIMVVDSQNESRESISSTLLEQGHYVVKAATPVEAIEKAAGQKFDLMLLHFGNSATSDIEAVSAWSDQNDVPVLALIKGGHGPGNRSTGSECQTPAGCCRPFDWEEAINIINSLLVTDCTISPTNAQPSGKTRAGL